jgi:hypothetical protein
MAADKRSEKTGKTTGACCNPPCETAVSNVSPSRRSCMVGQHLTPARSDEAGAYTLRVHAGGD